MLHNSIPLTAVWALIQLYTHMWGKKVASRPPRDATLSSHYHGVETRSRPVWLQLAFLPQQLRLIQHTNPPRQAACSAFVPIIYPIFSRLHRYPPRNGPFLAFLRVTYIALMIHRREDAKKERRAALALHCCPCWLGCIKGEHVPHRIRASVFVAALSNRL